MSLKARLRSLEAKVEWLERWGELRKVESALKYRQSTRQIVDQLEANPKAAARLGVADMVGTRPGRSAGRTLADVIADGRARAARADAAVPAATGPPLEKPPKKPAAAPSPPPSPLPMSSPKTEAWTHDPPEHMQIEKVTWRRRGPEDDLDDEEEEYDAFGGG